MSVIKNKLGWRLSAGLLAGIGFCGISSVSMAEHPYAGLWVGRAAVSHVNEVAVPLDENNIPIAPDPNVPTPSYDAAYIRLIIHVNGQGQVNLLRDVAVLRVSDTNATSSAVSDAESDYVLVSDDRLYTDFISKDATRIASAAFEFGDRKATDALDVIVASVCSNVTVRVLADVEPGMSTSTYRAAEVAAQTAAESAATPLVETADVAEYFFQFLSTHLNSDAIVELASDVSLNIESLREQAVMLRDRSFYGDTRALSLVNELESALTAEDAEEVRNTLAQNIVARYADIDNQYQRFIHGISFGNMISEAAFALAETKVAEGTNVTVDVLNTAVDNCESVLAARAEAVRTLMPAYEDDAATSAVETVIKAMVNVALTSSEILEVQLRTLTESVGLTTLEKDVPRFALQMVAPTADYTTYVKSDEFKGSVSTAANAAALAAVKEAKNNKYATQVSVYNAARIAAVNALNVPYASAARARQCELPLVGHFGVGNGDARLISAGGAPLSSAALTGTIKLPAVHPVNPFRHRRHPDHTSGLTIIRDLRFDFDETESVAATAYGVDQVSGIFREEIFGLHKPLGTDPIQNPIGLKVEGTFELSRISRIDTLNAY